MKHLLIEDIVLLCVYFFGGIIFISFVTAWINVESGVDSLGYVTMSMMLYLLSRFGYHLYFE